jgi:hypothetical protein
MQTTNKRSNVTVDDRRAILPAARVFKPTMKETREQFIRNALKARLGWPARDPAPQSVLDATKQLAAFLNSEEKAKRALAAEQIRINKEAVA